MPEEYDKRELYQGRRDPSKRWAVPRSTGKYFGVRPRRSGKYQAFMKIDGKFVSLGMYDTELQAAMAYDEACDKMDGRHHRNFSENAMSQFSKTEERIATEGDYVLESQACEAFDSKIAAIGDQWFHVEKEVQGWYVQPRAAVTLDDAGKYPRPRIDRILHPKPALLAAGWREGALGVEIKRSDVKAGSAIVQATEYQRAVFDTPIGGLIMLKWVFLWPLGPSEGDISVIMAQNRVGYCSGRDGSLSFGCGNERFLNFILSASGGDVRLNVQQPPAYSSKIGGRTAKPVSERGRGK